ncbi:type II secretion system F family protein [soil metagenome]
MDTSTIVIGAAFGVAGIGAIAAGVAGNGAERRGSSATAYLRSLDGVDDGEGGQPLDDFSRRLSQPFLDRILSPAIGKLVATVTSVTPSDHRVRIRTKLAQAGLDLRRRPEEIIAAQVAGAVIGFLLGIAVLLSGSFSPLLGILATALLLALGAFAPMAWLSRKVDERMQAIRADLPDTLDLLAISVEAGVGLEGAMAVVTDRFDSPLAEEIGRTLQEMGLGLTRRDALSNLKQRSQVPELSSFVGALIQADALGMPLGRVLKVQATEMRSKRRQWARERAAKLPVKILFPLVLCIFPAVMVVVLGPAISQLKGAF